MGSLGREPWRGIPTMFVEFPRWSLKIPTKNLSISSKQVFQSQKNFNFVNRFFNVVTGCRPRNARRPGRWSLWDGWESGRNRMNRQGIDRIDFRNPRVIYMIYIWLVVSNMTFIFHIWDVILPIDELIFFRGVETTNQVCVERSKVWIPQQKSISILLILLRKSPSGWGDMSCPTPRIAKFCTGAPRTEFVKLWKAFKGFCRFNMLQIKCL